MKSKGIHHFKSAQYHPATNGLVERFNKTLKQAIKTGKNSGRSTQESIMQFLFIYRSTPHSVTEVASSKLFLGHKLKTKLDLMRPDVQRRVEEKQVRQKKGHDYKSKEKVFRVGEAVWFKDYRRGNFVLG